MSEVLLLAHAFPPENLTGAHRPARFAKFLPRHGCGVRVIAGRPDLEDGPLVDRVPRDGGAVTRAQSEALRLLQRYALPYDDYLPWTAHAVAAAARRIRSGEVVAVVSTFPPVATHAAGLWLKVRYGVRWVADFRDPLIDNPFRGRRWLFPYDQWLESAIFANADAIIANTDGAAEIWRRRYPRHSRKMRVIWNGFDPEAAVKTAPLRDGPELVIAHVGTLYGERHPRLLFESLERLGSGAPPCRIELIGTFEEAAERNCGAALERARQSGLVRQVGVLEREEANQRMAEADILLLLDVHASESSVQLPAKAFDYVRAGRPILAFTNAGSPVERVLASSGVDHACVFREDAPGTIDRKVGAFLGLGRRASQANDWFRTTFDGERQAAALAEIIRGIR